MILFPKTEFGSRNRSCQHNCFNNYPRRHCDIEKDSALFLSHEERIKTDSREKQRANIHISQILKLEKDTRVF